MDNSSPTLGAPAGSDESGKLGTGLNRVDGPLKVCGLARYTGDFYAPGLTHATMLQSRIAAGRVKRIDTAAALAHPGVLHVMTHLNAPRLPEGGQAGIKPPAGRTLSLLQDDRVHYDGQPIAVVVAETLEASRQGARLLKVEVEEETPVLDFEAAKAEAHPPEEAQGQEPDSQRGDPAGGWSAAAHRHEATYTTPLQHHNPLEPHATLAQWDGDRLTLWDSTQYVHGVRQTVAQRLGLSPEQVRVVNPFVGGAFGSKGSAWSHVVLAAMAAREVKRPVRLAVERTQMFGPVGNRPFTEQKFKLAADTEGRLTALEHHVHAETARIEDWIEPSALVSRFLYACDNVATSHRLVPLNVGVPTFQRAPGEATGTFALESAMDELAHAAGIDPLEFRLRNHSDFDAERGLPYSSKSLRECYARGAEAFNWSRRDSRPGAMRDGDALIGWGMATATYPAKRMPAEATAALLPDGRVRVECGTHDLGTGTWTLLTQVAADALDLPPSRIALRIGDSALPMAPVSGGSMTAASAGAAVFSACEELRTRLIDVVVADEDSPLHGVPHERVECRNGGLWHRNEPGRGEALATVAARHREDELQVKVKATPGPDAEKFSKHSFGAVFAEVRVDAELGVIHVPRIVAAYAVGRLLSAKAGRSQLLGGIVWGLSMALHEHSLRDPRYGRIANANLAEYHVPVNADVPDIELIVVPEDDPHIGPLGAKGIGEIGITGVAGAIANAVWHATGKRIRDLPISLDALL
ncbi:xanthine dehydrogenase family protein molybdopterin-binding subunit [Azohydromonas caseinilytica]|uniref:Xanthine dehydrogenase family protein molybdopterin-binding subunit n=1 Tax=Azohydromonas caseinilytica TaxID=2728836 RepID=A0A848F718_9BURK|nr:xanthine dehydrogenase family protein molybdopterin-binding subunit [Azohydromonas caseinilytica]NML14505.1 xanthine dehydrogenase family protein molybdopterin-binding subunit [Azohydromonas caseinilytica]